VGCRCAIGGKDLHTHPSYFHHPRGKKDSLTEAAIDKGSELSLGPLLPVMAGLNYSHVTQFRCPILLFEGRHDDTTPAQIAAKWLERVRAPAKKIIWFENSAHMAMVEEPGRFLFHLVQDARPYSERTGHP
jgi:pimeloyl-ACP methyl ester carboxylesterase